MSIAYFQTKKSKITDRKVFGILLFLKEVL